MITVLIFTYERHLHLRRSLSYWSGMNVNVIVADATKYSFSGDIPNNIDYIHMPNMSITNRLIEMVRRVNSPYVVLCADDDFLSDYALSTHIDFLEKNPEYSSAQGIYTRFWLNQVSRQLYWLFDYKYATKFKFDSKDPSERFLKALTPPIMHYCYAVMKVGALALSLDIMDGVEEQSISTFELSFIPGLMRHGKYATLPIFYQARQRQDIPDWDRATSFDNWYKQNSSKGYQKWRSNIIDLYCKNLTEKDLEIFVNRFDAVISRYVSYRRSKAKKNKENETQLEQTGLKIAKDFFRSYYYFFKNFLDQFLFFRFNFKRHYFFWKDFRKIKDILLTKYD